jgi:hypothetical protein
MKMTLKSVVSAAALVATLGMGTLLAVGAIDPWTKGDGYSYVDANFQGVNAAKVTAVKTGETGSGSEKEKTFEVRVAVEKETPSTKEVERFVGEVKSSDTLPATVELKKADENWEPAGSGSEGTLKLDQWDKTALKGELFEDSIDARALKQQ